MYLLTINFQNHNPDCQYVAEHTKWVKQAFIDNIFILAGAKKDDAGCLILTTGMPRETLNRLIEEDPLFKSGVASYSITPFEPTFYQNGLDFYITKDQVDGYE